MLDPFDLLQLVGLIGGVSGALLVTSRMPSVRAAGFLAWVGGNTAWAMYAISAGSIYLGVQFAIFLMLAVLGLMNNLRDSRGGPDVVERHC